MAIDPFLKWQPIINSFVSIRISFTNLVFKLIIQEEFYSQPRLVSNLNVYKSTGHSRCDLISQFGKYHNILCLSTQNFVCLPKILIRHCVCFLLGPLEVPRETGNNAYAKFG